MIRLAYAPDLVEESVLLAERTASIEQRRAFRRERDRLYEDSDAERREASFRRLHLRWFLRLGLQRVVEEVVGESPDLADRVGEGRVLRALTRHEEGADLLDRIATGERRRRPLLVLRLRPLMLIEAEAVRAPLRHELVHIADMLDPDFGYERTLASSDDGPSADNILRDRYRVLWDVTIDGRLARAGRCGDEARAARWKEFEAAFPMLGAGGREVFDDLFDRVRPTHAALAAFARAPGMPGLATVRGAGRCPLCRFPTAALDRDPHRLSAQARQAIGREHPTWSIEQGLCPQCFDLYEARREAIAGARQR